MHAIRFRSRGNHVVLRAARTVALLPTLAVPAFSVSALAAAANWDGNAPVGVVGDGTNWSNPNNWTIGGAVDTAPSNTAPGDDLTFGGGTVGQINLQANRFANSISFSAGFTLFGTTDTLTVSTGNITVSASASATIDTELAGSNGLNKLGTGTLNLDLTDSFTGATNVSAGTLAALGSGSLPGATTIASAGTLDLNSNVTLSGNLTSSGTVAVGFGSTASLSGVSSSYTQNAGTLTVGGTLLLTAGTFDYNGGSIAGTVTLNIDSTFDSPVVSFGTGAGNSGNFLFDGVFGTVAGAAIPSGVTLMLQPNPATYTAGLLAFSATNVSNAGNVEMIGAPTVSISGSIGGTLTNSGSFSVGAVGLPSTNPDFFGGGFNNAGTLSIAAPLEFQGTLTNSGNIATMAGGTLGIYNGSIFYQNAGSVNVAAGTTLDATFGMVYANGGTITLTSDATAPATMKFYELLFNASSGTGIIASGTVGPGQSPGYVDLHGSNVFFDIAHGSAANDVVISAPLTDGAIEKTDTGTLMLSGKNGFTALTIDDGKVVAGAAGALPANLSVSIGATGVLAFAAGIGEQTFSSLVITSGGKVDINNDHLIISYGATNITSTIGSQLTQRYNGGAWNGPGIDSSAAAANSHYALGYADGADNIVPGLSSGQVEIKYTLYGDINLDGLVNGTDFGILASHFGKNEIGWDKGDMNYDGNVNGSDFALLAENFGKNATGASVLLPQNEWSALEDFAAAHGLLADVPEPAALPILALAAVGALRRRRSRLRYSGRGPDKQALPTLA
jgi:fibronectin-binding autotransporter adhesin